MGFFFEGGVEWGGGGGMQIPPSASQNFFTIRSVHPMINETWQFVTRAEPFIIWKWTGPADKTALNEPSARTGRSASLAVASLSPLRSPVRARRSLPFGGVINVTRSRLHPLGDIPIFQQDR